MSEGAYARAGVDASRADRAVAGLVEVLRSIDPGRPSRQTVGPGHYAAVIALDKRLGVALSTDGVGTKVIVAQEVGRLDSVGVDCVAMNVNDVICVGATPLAVLDYLAVEEADPERLRELGEGLRRGAEQAGVEIPGGELAQLPELLRGHPSPRGFDLVGSCFGTVHLDRVVTGSRVEPGDAIIGLPSSGIHSNGLTLARRALPDVHERPSELGGRPVGEELLEPTTIYVRAVLDLLEADDVDVRGLAHITSGGLLNLLRLGAGVGYRVDQPLPRPAVFDLIAERSGTPEAELQEVFNLGCGFSAIVPAEHADAAVERLTRRHPGTALIGTVTDRAGLVELTAAGLEGRAAGGFRPA
ncbi:MAG TPA: phosphoribosylformylglycinamidine cyclo-ligase [Thermoleophilaceae bacterium]|nr:phosphoribosylformylglycinamidine cyclo-ligase [Thermoleophilaceae bacterium]